MDDVMPDPGNALSGYRYLFQEAGNGMFDEASDLPVILYLWTHAWRRFPNSDGFPVGWVQSEHTSVSSIARGTALGRKTASRALDRLRERGWIETELIDRDDWRHGQNIWVRIDPDGHRARRSAVVTMTTSCGHHDHSEPVVSSLIYKEQSVASNYTGELHVS